jgi:transposase
VDKGVKRRLVVEVAGGPLGAAMARANGQKTYPARRWEVERMLVWRSKGRGLLVQYEKTAVNFVRLRQLAVL